jgi:hypothetical protein
MHLIGSLWILFYMNRLWNIAKWVEKDFNQMTEDDAKELVRKIAQINYTERTKIDHYCVIKFFKWLDSDDRGQNGSRSA